MSGDHTQDLIEHAEIYKLHSSGEARLICQLAETLLRYQRRVVAHHEISTLSDEVLRDYDYRNCSICARSDEAT